MDCHIRCDVGHDHLHSRRVLCRLPRVPRHHFGYHEALRLGKLVNRSARFLTAPPLLLVTQLIGTRVARDK